MESLNGEVGGRRAGEPRLVAPISGGLSMALLTVIVLSSASSKEVAAEGFLGLMGRSLGGFIGCFCILLRGVSPPASSSSELSILEIGIWVTFLGLNGLADEVAMSLVPVLVVREDVAGARRAGRARMPLDVAGSLEVSGPSFSLSGS